MTRSTREWPAPISGAAYDPATGRIFISQAFADGDLPVIHVFELQ